MKIQKLYWAQSTKPIEHVKHRIPPCAQISQELKLFKDNNLWGISCLEPTLCIAVCDNLIKGISTLA
jgi:hypothetical protein